MTGRGDSSLLMAGLLLIAGLGLVSNIWEGKLAFLGPAGWVLLFLAFIALLVAHYRGVSKTKE